MDAAARRAILDRIRRDVVSIDESDCSLVERAMAIILQMSSDPRMGPLTFLMPHETAVKRIDFDEDAPVPPELRDQCIGLLLDQTIIGKLPRATDVEPPGVPFSTLGGATAILTVEGDGLVLTDTTGRKVRVSDPVVDGPKMTMRQSDDFLMWDEWGWPPQG